MLSKKERGFCVHCEPLIEKHSWLSRVVLVYFAGFANLFVGVVGVFFTPFLKKFYGLEKKFAHAFIRVMSKLRVIKVAPITNTEEIQGRSLTIVEEAKKRGYTVNLVKFFNRHFNTFQLNFKNKSLFFNVLPSADFERNNIIDFSDKYLFKLLLESNNFPHTQGESFRRLNTGLSYGNKLGYPLVVKPRFGSLSKHTSVGIRSENELKDAIKTVKIITDEFIVERYVKGKDYRVAVVENKMVACAFREPPNVIGDGSSTIEQLIMVKNNDPFRGTYHQKNFTLKKINITPRVEKLLMQKNYTVKSIPSADEKIYLDTKVVLSGGSDIHDVTDMVHGANVKLLEKLSMVLETSLVGFDIITPDISKPYYDTTFVVIEANSAPYIDMHHFPTSGSPRNVAARIIDSIESKFFLH